MEEVNKFTAKGYEQYKRCLEAGYAEAYAEAYAGVMLRVMPKVMLRDVLR